MPGSASIPAMLTLPASWSVPFLPNPFLLPCLPRAKQEWSAQPPATASADSLVKCLLFLPYPGPHQRLLQRQHLQRAPLNPDHLPVQLPARPAPHGQAASAHRHVLHQHLQHLEWPGPPLRLWTEVRVGHGQLFHRAL